MAHRPSRIRIVVSACLLGERVRYDGDHSRDPGIADCFGQVFTMIPECPEVGIGLGVPRPRIRLREDGGGNRLVGADGSDLTGTMRQFSEGAVSRFTADEVGGLILKSRSPSCGIGDVPVYRDGREPHPEGTGIHAATLRERMPEVPAITETGLADPARRDDWLVRVFGLAEVRRLGGGIADLQRFHSRWKMELMAHSESATRRLGRMLAARKDPPRLLAAYREGFLAALAVPSTVGAHRNVLQHLAGHLDGQATTGERRRVHEGIDAFVRGETALREPIRPLVACGRRVASLRNQAYLEAWPAPLGYRETPWPAVSAARGGDSASTRR